MAGTEVDVEGMEEKGVEERARGETEV